MKGKTLKNNRKNNRKVISGILEFYIISLMILKILTWPIKTVFIADLMIGIAMAICWTNLVIYFGFSIIQCAKVLLTDSKKRNL